ncbi:MAG: hypothetical protein J0I75_15595 [Hyphomicrobium sp.]|nr:hypothetical protein [Hyphomicrobium sp.]
MAITTAMQTSFKKEMLEGVHNFKNSGGDTIKVALFTSSATLDASTTAYSTTNEVSGTGYSAGGNTLTRVDPASSGTTAFTDFADTNWSTATITARGCQHYNNTDSDKSIITNDFGSDKSSSGGTFTLTYPTADASNAIIRIA